VMTCTKIIGTKMIDSMRPNRVLGRNSRNCMISPA
jgi:hypothetical protein